MATNKRYIALEFITGTAQRYDFVEFNKFLTGADMYVYTDHPAALYSRIFRKLDNAQKEILYEMTKIYEFDFFFASLYEYDIKQTEFPFKDYPLFTNFESIYNYAKSSS